MQVNRYAGFRLDEVPRLVSAVGWLYAQLVPGEAPLKEAPNSG